MMSLLDLTKWEVAAEHDGALLNWRARLQRNWLSWTLVGSERSRSAPAPQPAHHHSRGEQAHTASRCLGHRGLKLAGHFALFGSFIRKPRRMPMTSTSLP